MRTGQAAQTSRDAAYSHAARSRQTGWASWKTPSGPLMTASTITLP